MALIYLLSFHAWQAVFDLLLMRWHRSSKSAQYLIRIASELVHWLIIVVSRHSSHLVQAIIILISLIYLRHGCISYDVLRLHRNLMLDCRWITDPRLRMPRLPRLRNQRLRTSLLQPLWGFQGIWWLGVNEIWRLLVHKNLRSFAREWRNSALRADCAKTHILLIIVQLDLRGDASSLCLGPVTLRIVYVIVFEVIMVQNL